MITIDFETYYDQEYSLSKLSTEEYIRDPRFQVIGVSVKIDNEPAVWFSGGYKETKDFLVGFDFHNQYVLAHNAVFDGAILTWHFGISPKYYLDTLSMARPITGATVGGSLAKLAVLFNLGEKGTEVIQAKGKRQSDFAKAELDQYGEYCKNDCDLTYLLYKVLRQYFPASELFIIDLMIKLFTQPMLELDRSLLIEHLADVQAKKQALLDKMKACTPVGAGVVTSVELASNKQLAQLLISLGVVPPMKPSPAALKRGETKMTHAFGKTDSEFIALLSHENPQVQAVVAARLGIKSTLEETRTESFLGASQRGHLPILLNYYGAHTGRASGGDKMNLQNLPRGGKLREAICPPDGMSLLAGDSAQIEARVVAWLAGQEDLLRAFRQGEDIYSAFASDVFQKVVTKADTIERFVGKTCILGLGYGMGALKFAATLLAGEMKVRFDEAESKRVVKLYRQTYPAIVALWDQADACLQAMANSRECYLGVGIALKCNGEGVHLPNGMIMRYANMRQTADGFEYSSRYGPVKLYGGKLVENVVQALARIVVFSQMSIVEQWLRQTLGGKTVLTVHDEIVLCVFDQCVGQAKIMLAETMSVAPRWAANLPLACEVRAGKNYASCK